MSPIANQVEECSAVGPVTSVTDGLLLMNTCIEYDLRLSQTSDELDASDRKNINLGNLNWHILKRMNKRLKIC